MHPLTVVYLEHDGKVLLVDGAGDGPLKPEPGRLESDRLLRFPTHDETQTMGIVYTEKGRIRLMFGNTEVEVVKAYPDLDWPKNWAWKDACIADNPSCCKRSHLPFTPSIGVQGHDPKQKREGADG